MKKQKEVLDSLLRDVEAAAKSGPIVVFDLDDTLLSTARRHLKILSEYSPKLGSLKPEHLHYSITDTAKGAGITDEAALKELRDFWFARFFTNDYVRLDEEIEGGAAYCRDTRAAGARVVYLTGRDETMREGTMDALGQRGFPVPDAKDIVLILKPRFETPDLEYKTAAIERLRSMGEVLGNFDNEPAHVNIFREAFPKSRTIFVDTKHSGKPVAPHPSIPWIKNFRRAP